MVDSISSIVVLIYFVVVLIWCGSTSKTSKPIEVLKHLIDKFPELEIDDSTKKVTVFFGTQIGNAEDFTKVIKLTSQQV